MGTSEAIDLIRMLPDGSRYVVRTDPERSWGEARQRTADVVDAISHLTWAIAYDHDKMAEPPRVTRPRDMMARVRAMRAAAQAKAELESGTWEEM